jgi:hypothetical protein
MSLYKQAETTLYFKNLAEKEDTQSRDAPKIRQSRVARILSLKNDLVCIKDVVNLHEQTMQRRTLTRIPEETLGSITPGGPRSQPFNAFMKNSIKQLYQTPKPSPLSPVIGGGSTKFSNMATMFGGTMKSGAMTKTDNTSSQNRLT